ncbi:MAG: putative isomerase YddE [Planctomycetota bacterium]|jgi:predicted PhzF superfamily epimerase YddE/YHI9
MSMATEFSIPLFLVDAFTSEPFRGNQAAVCLLPEPRSDAWLQRVAAEMNVSETVFVIPEDQGRLRIRWLTPAVEVDLCGHATLAAAHILQELHAAGELPEYAAAARVGGLWNFESRSGRLTAEPTGSGITLDFPALPVTPTAIPGGLPESLGIDARDIEFCGQTRFDLLLRLPTAAAVRRLQPDFAALGRLPVRGVIVTALGDTSDHDFLSRFFAPASGVPEDPVTGSAHCALAVYWAPEFGRSTLFGFQASRRGGHVKMELQQDRVRLSGRAVTVSRGKLVGPAAAPEAKAAPR